MRTCVCTHLEVEDHHHCQPVSWRAGNDPQQQTCQCDGECRLCPCPGFIEATLSGQMLYDDARDFLLALKPTATVEAVRFANWCVSTETPSDESFYVSYGRFAEEMTEDA